MRSPAVLTLTLVFVLLLGCGGPPASRVIVLGLDGMDPDVIDLLISQGKLPNFSRLKDEGTYARLYSPPPLMSPVIWTTIATGKRPSEHGIGAFTRVDPETGEELPVTSNMRRVKALWNIFSEEEKEVAVVGWWATWPAEPVKGAIVSDHASFHFLMGHRLAEEEPTEFVTYPDDLLSSLSSFMRKPQDVGHDELRGFIDIDASELEGPFDFQDDVSHFRWALGAAKTHRDIGLHLWQNSAPDLLLVYVEGVDTTSHLFGHLYLQYGLAGELEEQQRRYGDAVEAMYVFADEIVGDYIEVMDEETTLLVLSDHGFKLGELPTDPSKTRDMRRVSADYHREEGILYLYGRGIAPGRLLKEAETLDITPTVLALAGLNAARDMPGRILHDAMDPPPSVARVTTYETGDSGSAARTRRDGAVDAAVMEKLESLGYLGTTTTSNDKNLAWMMLKEGRHEEAAVIFADLVEADPDETALRTGLGTALGGLGREQEALAELGRALELDPLNIPAYHNRGLVHERIGDIEAAIEDYRTAVRYKADYLPSLEALRRLGVDPAQRVAATPEEEQAAELLRQAGFKMKRGDYDAAETLISQARELAPDVPAIYNAQANVAYLKGDREAAADAIRKALELEPDNVLLQDKLRKLEK